MEPGSHRDCALDSLSPLLSGVCSGSDVLKPAFPQRMDTQIHCAPRCPCYGSHSNSLENEIRPLPWFVFYSGFWLEQYCAWVPHLLNASSFLLTSPLLIPGLQETSLFLQQLAGPQPCKFGTQQSFVSTCGMKEYNEYCVQGQQVTSLLSSFLLLKRNNWIYMFYFILFILKSCLEDYK